MESKSKSYRDLEIYKLSYDFAIEVHKMTLGLPKYEMYEQGSQLRRSSKSIKDNIVEGYGRKRYKNEFIKYLVYSLASCDETSSHLAMIQDLHFEKNELDHFLKKYNVLGKKINKFIQYVEENWKS